MKSPPSEKIGVYQKKILPTLLLYFLAAYLIILSVIEESFFLATIFIVSVLIYLSWPIFKNYRTAKKRKTLLSLPFLKLKMDFSVLANAIGGFLKNLKISDFVSLVKQNKGITFIIFVYASLMISLINWGIPNESHPFNYFMDEWHQSQSVRMVFAQGTPNVPGSANGSMFHFFLSGLYLIPFVVLGIINPFVIHSSLDALDMQQRLFEVLRLNILLFEWRILFCLDILRNDILSYIPSLLFFFLFLIHCG